VGTTTPAGRVSRRAGAQSGKSTTAVGTLRAVSDARWGERCVLAIRPENVAVDAKSGGRRRQCRARAVSFVSYLGSALRYDVEAGHGQVLKADIRDPWHHEPLSIGREVAVSFPASVTLAVARMTELRRRPALWGALGVGLIWLFLGVFLVYPLTRIFYDARHRRGGTNHPGQLLRLLQRRLLSARPGKSLVLGAGHGGRLVGHRHRGGLLLVRYDFAGRGLSVTSP